MKKLVITFVIVVIAFGGILPFARHAHLRTMLEADLRNIRADYNTFPRADFLDRVEAMCERSEIEAQFEIELVDGKNGAFTLTVSYVDEFRVLFLFKKLAPAVIVIEGTRIEA